MAVTTAVDVCNLALPEIGVLRLITAIDGSDTSKEGLACQRIYNQTLDMVLSSAWWQFAEKRVMLQGLVPSAYASGTSYNAGDYALYQSGIWYSLAGANAGNQPDLSPTKWQKVSSDEYGHYYPNLPTDAVTLRYLYPPDLRIPYRIVGNPNSATYTAGLALLTNAESPAELVYTQRATNPVLYPPEFIDALKWNIAAELVMPLAVSPKLAAAAEKKAADAISAALTNNWNEWQEEPRADSELVRVRGRGTRTQPVSARRWPWGWWP